MEKRTILIIVVVVAVILIALSLWYTVKCARDVKKDSSRSASPSFSSRFETNAPNASSPVPRVENIKVEQAGGQTQVSWKPLANADHYTMYYSPTANFDKNFVNKHDPIQDSSMVLSSDVPQGYYFKVTAHQNIDGKLVESDLSAEHYMLLDSSN